MLLYEYDRKIFVFTSLKYTYIFFFIKFKKLSFDFKNYFSLNFKKFLKKKFTKHFLKKLFFFLKKKTFF